MSQKSTYIISDLFIQRNHIFFLREPAGRILFCMCSFYFVAIWIVFFQCLVTSLTISSSLIVRYWNNWRPTSTISVLVLRDYRLERGWRKVTSIENAGAIPDYMLLYAIIIEEEYEVDTTSLFVCLKQLPKLPKSHKMLRHQSPSQSTQPRISNTSSKMIPISPK